MRIAYVCTDPGVPVFGTKGAALHVRAIVREMVRRGHEVHLVCARTGEPEHRLPAELDRVRVHRLPPVGRGEAAQREVAAQATDRAVAGVLDAVAAGDGIDLVYERYALWGSTATDWARERDVVSVLEVNAPLVEEQALHRHLVDRAAAERVAREAMTAAGTVVCVTDAVRDWAREVAPRPEGIVTVGNGVDTDRVRPAVRRVAPAHAGIFTVGFVGSLKPWHGTDVLLEAMARLSRRDADYRLLLVGSGPQRTALLDQAQRYGLPDLVEATGAVPSEQVPALLHRMDLACAPYPSTEDCYFSPLKVYEYLAAGLPVVASDVGVLPELLDRGRLGRLVRPGDPAALAEAIAALRADVSERTRLRDAARAAAEDHDWGRVLDRILALTPLPREVRGVA